MSRRFLIWSAWSVAAVIVAIALVVVIAAATDNTTILYGGDVPASELFWAPLPAIFAVLGALIITYQSRNPIGWLLLVPAFGSSLAFLINFTVGSLEAAPPDPGFFIFLAVWFENWSWVWVIFPILLFLQIFPTGRVLNRRWRWLLSLMAVMAAALIFVVTFSTEIGPSDGWLIDNPIGFLPPDFFDRYFNLPWTIALFTLTVGGALSTILRFRRAKAEERQQMKWLVWALLFFALIYATAGVFNQEMARSWIDALFSLSIVAIPVAITLAITRNRLFDIDLIIRRTVVYAFLTGILTAVYLGSIFVSQSLFQLEERASWQVAASTLLVAALFSPLRRRIQGVIDRRLFRHRYDAQQVVERFAGSAQNQSDLALLSADLVGVVHQTIQPSQARLWIRA